MAALEAGSPLEEQVKLARAAYKRSQRAYREQRNAVRVAQIEAQMEERVKVMLERRAQAEAETATKETSANGRKRA
jgi:hypothetical protein